jgi:hypothetical protein
MTTPVMDRANQVSKAVAANSFLSPRSRRLAGKPAFLLSRSDIIDFRTDHLLNPLIIAMSAWGYQCFIEAGHSARPRVGEDR